jgi:hypothetical protein
VIKLIDRPARQREVVEHYVCADSKSYGDTQTGSPFFLTRGYKSAIIFLNENRYNSEVNVKMQLSISFTLSDSFLTTYRNEYFSPNFQEEDVDRQILEKVDLQRKIAEDIVNSIRKEKPDELFSLLDPLYNEVENFDGAGLIKLSITDKEEAYESILTDMEDNLVTKIQMEEGLRKGIAKDIIDAIRDLE